MPVTRSQQRQRPSIGENKSASSARVTRAAARQRLLTQQSKLNINNKDSTTLLVHQKLSGDREQYNQQVDNITEPTNSQSNLKEVTDTLHSTTSRSPSSIFAKAKTAGCDHEASLIAKDEAIRKLQAENDGLRYELNGKVEFQHSRRKIFYKVVKQLHDRFKAKCKVELDRRADAIGILQRTNRTLLAANKAAHSSFRASKMRSMKRIERRLHKVVEEVAALEKELRKIGSVTDLKRA